MKGGECAGVCEAHHLTATKRFKHKQMWIEAVWIAEHCTSHWLWLKANGTHKFQTTDFLFGDRVQYSLHFWQLPKENNSLGQYIQYLQTFLNTVRNCCCNKRSHRYFTKSFFVCKLNRINKSQTVQIQYTVNFGRGNGVVCVCVCVCVQYIKTNMVHIW